MSRESEEGVDTETFVKSLPLKAFFMDGAEKRFCPPPEYFPPAMLELNEDRVEEITCPTVAEN